MSVRRGSPSRNEELFCRGIGPRLKVQNPNSTPLPVPVILTVPHSASVPSRNNACDEAVSSRLVVASMDYIT